MTGKTDKKFMFDVQLSWLVDKKGVLSATDTTSIVHVATPPQFGGTGKSWSPEHLFLSAISSCFMTTYLAFAEKLDFGISGFDCNTIGQIELVEGKYKFTRVDIYPRVYIVEESLREKARAAVENTHKYCLITNSVNATVYCHSEIIVDQNSGNGGTEPDAYKESIML
jgi:organic hydroperoxide reductase OsmC/OhrA